MRAIQYYLPNPRHKEVHRIFVKAKPNVAWEAARHFDGADIPWIRVIFNLRQVGHFFRREKSPMDRRIGVDQVAENGEGFRILEEIPGKQVVVGAIGKFWQLGIPYAEVDSGDFGRFNLPGWGKVAWVIGVEPYLTGSSVSFELRTTATDEDSWKKLNTYYYIIGMASRLIRSSVMSHLEAELGKMKFAEDEDAIFPGDEIIPDARHQITFHKNIEAPPLLVWRYLMQLGCDRAGWYSIDSLEEAEDAGTHHLVPGWEKRAIGDKLAATPAKDSFYEVYALEKEKYFIIGSQTERVGRFFRISWAFILTPIGLDATHLVSHARMTTAPKLAEWLTGRILYPPTHGLMSGVQLSNIKRWAERDALQRMPALKTNTLSQDDPYGSSTSQIL
jgi:hypothetical protein